MAAGSAEGAPRPWRHRSRHNSPPALPQPLTPALRTRVVPAEKEHKRYHSLGNIIHGRRGGGGDKPSGPAPRSRLDPAKVLGTTLCPRILEVLLVEPLVCKKFAQVRLMVLLFLEDCIITACQEGLLCTWAWPDRAEGTRFPFSSPPATSPSSVSELTRSASRRDGS